MEENWIFDLNLPEDEFLWWQRFQNTDSNPISLGLAGFKKD